ncbi:MAG: cellulose-binding protein CttA-related protein, partial [Oscillospiraceae bacterium]|nr:cellulose-binding protein CttA-related protein [Oscillospiraceae bacterium]
IVAVAKQPHFYFSVDDREFNVADLFESIILTVEYEDGSTDEIDLIAEGSATCNGLTPETLFNDNAAVNTSEYDGVYRGMVSAYYNGNVIEGAESLVYIGVKGDASLNGVVGLEDASAVLSYYANIGASLPAAFTDDATSDYEILAYFLADVTTESTAGKNSDAGDIGLDDASYILTYYAYVGASLEAQWDEIIPSLKTLAGSLWEARANA